MGSGEYRLKRLIVTADDFGRSAAANEAVEDAFRNGILTAASLMVGADAAEDAVVRARQLDDLGVGLHIVVVCGRAVLPAEEIPDLVDSSGMFDTNLVRAGFRYFFLPNVRRQLAREIRAQFDVFQKTGLPLDHVNAHNHMHLHPTVLSLILDAGRAFGLRAMRVPDEPSQVPGAPPLSLAGRLGRRFLGVWLGLMRVRLRRAGVAGNDRVYGIRDSGALVRERMLSLLAELPDGVTEIFSHPARGGWDGVEEAARHYRFEDEFRALVDAEVKAAAAASGATLTAFRGI